MLLIGPENFRRTLFMFLLLCGLSQLAISNPLRAEEIRVAVAANFFNPLKDIAGEFKKTTGHQVKISSGSTGKLYAQISHGAPFDLFLAADSERPRLLEQNGQTVPGSRFTYAMGRLTLWSADSQAISQNGPEILKMKNFRHIALANPKTAPYGKAAVQTLKKLGLWEALQPMVVQGENIGQTFQFVASHNAELGFVALSQILDPKNTLKGSRWDVPMGHYDPLAQDVVILKRAEANPLVKTFWEFLKGTTAGEIIKRYGYLLPDTDRSAQ